MDVRFAPLEGLTDTIYRRTHHEHFGGVSKYYIPFVSPTQHHVFTPKEMRAIGPAYNAGITTVPQIIAKDAAHFLWAAGEMAAMGYEEVNLNIGCPSGTVTAKGKGAGMLRELYALDAFLNEVCAKSPIAVSVKTRIGFDSHDEWPEILDVLSEWPLKEIIIHPRTRAGFYKEGTIQMDTFRQAAVKGLKIVYNGDLFTTQDVHVLQAEFPGMPMMMGRGLVCNPALAQEVCGGKPLDKVAFRAFHDALWDAYRQDRPLDQAHSRMRELMIYMSCAFADADKAAKNVRKSNPKTYDEAVDRLFEHDLAVPPAFSQAGIGM